MIKELFLAEIRKRTESQQEEDSSRRNSKEENRLCRSDEKLYNKIVQIIYFHLYIILLHWGVVESGQVESGQDYFDWRSTRYFTKTVESGVVESGQNEQSS